MTPQIYEKFSEANNWIMNAIIEKVYGRMFNHDEIVKHVNIKSTEGKGGSTQRVYLDNNLIFSSTFKVNNTYVDEETCDITMHGYFSIPEIFMDEFIKEKTTNWMK